MGKCLECGAELSDGETCQEFFHQMLYWENEVAENGSVHHLMVLCFYLQHPALYSKEGLVHARQLLKDFILEGFTPSQVRKERRSQLSSDNRKWKLKGDQDNRGSYNKPMVWKMTAHDVVQGGIEKYIASVTAWAEKTCEVLQENENV